ncbi:MAG: hypothetical protein MUP63_03115 [Candidatus Nanohaloarchaeota archaeon QJJ-7]|nr:hypothetical protein [Candidatus Nanohaloarchaeota archaeon QJJ-7]
MRAFKLVMILFIFSALLIPVATAQGFEIDTVEGEDADQVNMIELEDRMSIEVGLRNASYENAKFMAYLDGQEMFMGDDEEITIKPEYDISEGEHELRIERQSRREEDISRTTMVEVSKTGSGSSDEETQDNVDFKIKSIDGEDAGQMNKLDVKVGERVDVGLEGADFEDSKFTAYIDGTELHVEDEGIVMVSDIKNVGTGQHELELEYYHAGEGTSTATTQVEIVDIEDRRPDRGSDPEEFEIDSVAGEDSDQVNEIELSEGDRLDIELEEMDLGERRFKAYIDGHEFPIDEDGMVVTSETGKLDEGEHTLRVAIVIDGEPATEDETEIEITDIETRGDRRQPEVLDSELYDEDFSPDVDGIDVDRGNGEITVTVTEESLENSDGEVVVGDSIEAITKLQINFRRGLGGHGGAARLKIEEKDPDTVDNEDIEVYSVLELSGKNLELMAPDIRYAVEDGWADEHGFDEAIRERGGGRQNTEIGFYDVEEDWKRFDTFLRDTTPTHSIYSLNPRRIDQDFNLESETNMVAIGGNPEGGLIYAEGPQGQCESFTSEGEIPSGWNELDVSCVEMEEMQRKKERLSDNIDSLEEDIKEKDAGDEQHIERLEEARNELDKGNIDEAERIYEEVQGEVQKGFLRSFIIQTVVDAFPFLG